MSTIPYRTKNLKHTLAMWCAAGAILAAVGMVTAVTIMGQVLSHTHWPG
jgi:hypothetical protein